MMDPEKFHDAFFRWTGHVAQKIEVLLLLMEKRSEEAKRMPRADAPYMW